MKVVYVSSEMVPFAKTGGLADVAGALPGALAGCGVEVSAFMPCYSSVKAGKYDVKPTGVKVTMPLGDIPVEGEVLSAMSGDGKVPIYFIAHDAYFDRPELYGTPQEDYPDNAERFAFFSRAVIEAVDALGIEPDVFHVNDWQSALIPVYLKTIYGGNRTLRSARTLLTIHNMAYQGLFPMEQFPLLGIDWQYFNWRELEFYGKVNFLKGGIVFSEAVSTVSKRYAEEIATPEFGAGLDGVFKERAANLYGIVNGVDYSVWDPSTDRLIPHNYSAEDLSGKTACKEALQAEVWLPVDPKVPLIGMIGRLVPQKGLDIFIKAAIDLMKMNLQVVILGAGSLEYHKALGKIAAAYPKKMALRLLFDDALAHRIQASCDIFLMPSRFEPCGLNQLYSLRYGTVPVVHATGGLADTITDCDTRPQASGLKPLPNGFSFDKYGSGSLITALEKAVAVYGKPDLWRQLQLTGMKQDWSWNRSADEYAALYRKLVER